MKRSEAEEKLHAIGQRAVLKHYDKVEVWEHGGWMGNYEVVALSESGVWVNNLIEFHNAGVFAGVRFNPEYRPYHEVKRCEAQSPRASTV